MIRLRGIELVVLVVCLGQLTACETMSSLFRNKSSKNHFIGVDGQPYFTTGITNDGAPHGLDFSNYRSQANIERPAPEHWIENQNVGKPGDHYTLKVDANTLDKKYVQAILKSLPKECGEFNKMTLETILERPEGGGYSGSVQPNNIPIYAGSKLVYKPKSINGPSFCSGETFGVFMATMSKVKPDPFANMTEAQLSHFKPGNAARDSYGFYGLWNDGHNGARSSVVNFGLGQTVKTLDAACPGDYVKFNRSKTGHSVIFLGYRNNGSEFCYWSSQETRTNGRGVNCEKISSIKAWNIARITTPENISKISPHDKSRSYLSEAKQALSNETNPITEPVYVDNSKLDQHLEGAI